MKKEELLIKEEWKDIKNYEGLYQISNLGRVKKINKSNIIICKPSIDTSGYKQIVLTKNKKRKSYKIHRLIAQAFIPNPNNLPQINHKDENKLNNDVSNLEWCTLQYNCNYGSRNYRCTRHRQHKVQQYNKQNNLVREYLSLKEAEKITKIKYQQISSCCRNKQKSAGGYIWKYC